LQNIEEQGAIMKNINSITFYAKRKVDKLLMQKLNAVAPYYYDDPTGTARKMLHIKLDEFIKEHGIDINDSQTQPTVG
jgi:hypothetical protein